MRVSTDPRSGICRLYIYNNLFATMKQILRVPIRTQVTTIPKPFARWMVHPDVSERNIVMMRTNGDHSAHYITLKLSVENRRQGENSFSCHFEIKIKA